MSTPNDESRNNGPLMVGLVFAAFIIAGNMLFTESTRSYITQNLRSPNGMSVRSVLTYVPALRNVGKNAYLDSEAFVRVQIFMNYALLTMFFFYLGFVRAMAGNAVRLTFRLLTVMGACYLGVLLFDRTPLGGDLSAIRWFQSAALVLCGGAAVLNYILVRRLMQAHPPRGRLRIFWFVAAFVCFCAALDRHFGLNTDVSATMQAALGRLDLVHFQASLGYPLAHLAPLGVSFVLLLVTACYAGLLRRHYGGRESDWHKPLAFGLLFMTAAACGNLIPDQVSFTPWLIQLSDILLSGTAVLFLATFSWMAVVMCRRFLISESLTAPAVVTSQVAGPTQSRPPYHTVDETEEMLVNH